MRSQKLAIMKSRRMDSDLCDLDKEWIAEAERKLGCRYCDNISFEPREVPDRVVVAGNPVAAMNVMLHFGIMIFKEPLARLLRECAFGIVELPVFRRSGGSEMRIPEHVAWYVPNVSRLNPHRGADSLHWICPECGGIRWANGAPDSVLARQLPGKPYGFFGSTGFLPIVDVELYAELRLRTLFPELRIQRIKVIDAPGNSQAIPGDPEWNGTLDVPFKGREEYNKWVRDWHDKQIYGDLI